MTQHAAVLKPYTHCWLHARYDLFAGQVDEPESLAKKLAGKVATDRFLGNKLEIVFSKLVRVVESKTDLRVPAGEIVHPKYPFVFKGCVVVNKTEDSITLRSSQGDEIVMTSNPEEAHKIDGLIAEWIVDKIS